MSQNKNVCWYHFYDKIEIIIDTHLFDKISNNTVTVIIIINTYYE